MYSITAVDCGATTFVHELGHNQGLAHSRKQGDTSGGVYVDGMGHGVQNEFASIWPTHMCLVVQLSTIISQTQIGA